MSEQRGSAFIMYTLAWLLILIMLGFFAYYLIHNHTNTYSKVIVSANQEGRTHIKVSPDRYHHYRLPCQINGIIVQCLIDSGASSVSIPAHYEKAMHLKRGFPLRVSTANGQIRVYSTTIDSLVIGSIELRKIRGNINPAIKSDEILLGMTALKYMVWGIHQGVLYLTPQE